MRELAKAMLSQQAAVTSAPATAKKAAAAPVPEKQEELPLEDADDAPVPVKTKAKPAKAKPAPQPEPEQADDDDEPEGEAPLTADEVKAELRKLGRPAIVKLLSQHGAAVFTDLKEADYPKIVKAARALVAEEAQ
jgi:hypothetical protein